MQTSFKIDTWLIEPELNRISKKSQTHALEPRLMRLLVLLAETPHELVSKDTILATVWAGLSVTDESLSQAISKLRKLLDEGNSEPSHIETIRKKGYRLVAAVSVAEKHHSSSVKRPAIVALCVAVAVAVATYIFGDAETARENTGFLVSTPATASRQRDRDPAISHDGNFLVYSQITDTSQHQIFLHGLGRGTTDRQLTNQSDNYAPAILPDDRAIAFMRKQQDTCSIILVFLIDGAERFAGNCAGNSYPDLAVAPNGLSVAFSARPTATEEHAIILLDIKTGERRTVSRPSEGIWGDYDPVFSADNKSLFFARSISEAMQDVYKLDIGTGRETRVTNDGRNIMGITVADGRALFASNRDGRYGIWSANPDGSDLHRLPISQTGIMNPTMSGQGQKLAFEAIQRAVALYAIKLDGISEPDPLLQFNAELLHPAINPASDRLVFSSNRSGFFEIWDADIRGNAERRLTDFRSGFTAHPQVSPDGKMIAFDARPSTVSQVYVMDENGNNLRAVGAEDGTNRYAPTWANKGQSLIYARETDGRLELWEYNLAARAETQLTNSGGTFGHLLSDGTLYHTRPNIAGVWRLSPNDQGLEKVLDGISFSDWGNWMIRDGKLHYFDRATGSLRTLNLDDFSVVTNAVVNGYVPTADPAIAFSQDGKTALVTIRQRLESDIEYVDMSAPRDQQRTP